MIKTFTQDDILLFVYNETDKKDREAIISALKSDKKLMAFYKQMRRMKDKIEEIALNPSERVIENILEYSRYTNTEEVYH